MQDTPNLLHCSDPHVVVRKGMPKIMMSLSKAPLTNKPPFNQLNHLPPSASSPHPNHPPSHQHISCNYTEQQQPVYAKERLQIIV